MPTLKNWKFIVTWRAKCGTVKIVYPDLFILLSIHLLVQVILTHWHISCGAQVTGKALLLDEIINYVQSLQNQVEVMITYIRYILITSQIQYHSWSTWFSDDNFLFACPVSVNETRLLMLISKLFWCKFWEWRVSSSTQGMQIISFKSLVEIVMGSSQFIIPCTSL